MKTPMETQNDLAEEIAVFRYGLIADVVREEPGRAGVYAALRKKASHKYSIPGTSRNRVAVETLRSWVTAYRKNGFSGLLPKQRSDRGRTRRIPAEVVDQLLHIKEGSPGLTVKQVIAAVIKNGNSDDVADVVLPESTVHRLLHRAGLLVKASGDGTDKDRRQFSYPLAGELWMSDVMHGPALRRDGQRKYKTYLIAFIDDSTRMVTHAQFCWSENTATFFPIFKTALLRRGIPLRLYVDNGAAYRSVQLELVCAKLGITLIHARPYQPQGKGKIERFFRTLRMQFLTQEHSTSIEEMNQRLWAWIEGEYHQTPHRGLGKETPADRWAQVAGKVRVVGPHTDLDSIFLWEAKRKVRTDRTVSLDGVFYEVAAELVRQTVTLRYDPSTAIQEKTLQVWCAGKRYDDAKQVNQHANCHVKRQNTTSSSSINFSQITGDKE